MQKIHAVNIYRHHQTFVFFYIEGRGQCSSNVGKLVAIDRRGIQLGIRCLMWYMLM